MRALAIVILLAGVAHADEVACERATCFALQLHVAAIDDAPVVSAEWIAGQLATANRQFAALDVGFTIAGSDADSAAHLRTRADRSALGTHVKGAVIHVFVTGTLENVDDPDEPVYGVTWRKGDRKFVILAANARGIVLAHELGHVFGLPHSTYAISIMNKTKREKPPFDERRFADEELAAMRRAVVRLVKTRVLANTRARR